MPVGEERLRELEKINREMKNRKMKNRKMRAMESQD